MAKIQKYFLVCPFEGKKLLPDVNGGLQLSSKVVNVWQDRESAVSHAKDLAATLPKTLILLFECTDGFEAKTPEVISKKWNENGEYLPTTIL